MKICVTGGSGMVGNCIRNISEHAYNEHDFVFLGNTSNNKYITKLDLINREQVLLFFSKNKFDLIIHLAAKVGGLYKNMRDNIGMFNDNIRINQNILEACHLNNINRGIFCLSSCIYPNRPNVFPMDETMIHESPPHSSNEGYAYSKRMLEMLCKQYNETYNREYICVIPVNLYGPYDNFSLDNGHFIPMIINRFQNKKNGIRNVTKSKNSYLTFLNNCKNITNMCTINKHYIAYGTGKPLRQFLYSPDFANIILKILFEKKNFCDSIICCNEEEYTIKDVVNEIAKIMHIDQKDILWDTTKSDGCLKKTVTNKKFRELYPEYKFTSLNHGLTLTYKWFLDNYNNIRV
tara:strand:+ start:1756 stop:2799 length:1044 start_codon:yes stop_codon:yes gene_type:complete